MSGSRDAGTADHANDGSGETNMRFTGQESAALVDCVQTWRYGVDARQHGFFLAKRIRGSSGTLGSPPMSPAGDASDPEAGLRPITPATPGQDLGFVWAVSSLASYEDGFFRDIDESDQFVCFADPSTYSEYPGWMLRNLLVLIRQRWGRERVRILCYRDIPSRRDEARSMVLDLFMDTTSSGTTEASSKLKISDMPKVTGWERNRTGKVTSRVTDLAEYMDPLR